MTVGLGLGRSVACSVKLLMELSLEEPLRIGRVRTASKMTKNVRTATKIINRVYGSHQKVQNVVVVACSHDVEKSLRSFLRKLCVGPCQFWHSRLIYKVIMTSEKGLAVNRRLRLL